MKRHMIFFHQGDCGCSQTGNAIPSCPPAQGALISDHRYLSLATSPKGQMIVVPKGSNSQTYLTQSFAGFVIYRGDGEVEVTRTPVLTLPVLNPAESGSYPLPGGFKYLTAGTGEPAEWRHVAAPTTGTYILHSENGVWVLKDAGAIPGIQTIGNSGTTAARGAVVGLVNTGTDEDPVWTIRRITVVDGRAMVGYVDPDTGVASWRALPSDQYLTHPKGRFTELNFRMIFGLDSDGSPFEDGFDQAVAFGAGAITDGKQLIYTPATNRLLFAPAHTVTVTDNSTNSAATVPPTSYTAMPSGHGAGVAATYNYPTVRIDFSLGMNSDASNYVKTFGLYRDGVLLTERDAAALTFFNLCYFDTTCPPGSHTYEVRWKRTSGSGTGPVISYSYLTASTRA